MKYQQEYIKLHNAGSYGGYSMLPFKHHVDRLVKNTQSKTLLDYGSGKGLQYSIKKLDLFWGVEVDCYDPGYEPHKKLPDKKYDGVVCTEVLEHIPEEELDVAMRNIFSRAEKFVFMSISTVLASKKFTDGTNVHVTVKEPKWWNEIIDRHNTNNVPVAVMFT